MRVIVYALEEADAKKLASALEAKGHEVVATASGDELTMAAMLARNPSYGIRAVVTAPQFAGHFKKLGLNVTQ